jgi:hypothetical protein
LSKSNDSLVKRSKRSIYALANRVKIGRKEDYRSKYHELYLKGEFDLEQKKHFLEQTVESELGYFPDIENPKTFNEKIQWYKLYYNDPLIARCIDKVSFKDYIDEVLGSEYIIPTLGVYSNADEIDFDVLPDQFVAKANFGSCAREIIIVPDKSKLDMAVARKTISGWKKPWWRSAWGGYEFVQPKILIEKYVEQLAGQVYDYKLWCFNGDPVLVSVHSDRFVHHTVDIFDLDWKKQPFAFNHPNSQKEIEPPLHFPQMIEISKRLSKPFPLVRVDFYEVEDRICVGELTFYPGGGTGYFEPKEWDHKIGEMLKMP